MSHSEIYYATRSKFKREEMSLIVTTGTYRAPNGDELPVSGLVDLKFSDAKTNEPLEIDLVEMVRHKAHSAYKSLLMPCIVEHAGLILEQHLGTGFPGGLTQPMWDSLGAEEFLRRTGASGERAVARAVVGYCNGVEVKTFIGETSGVLAALPRGGREFYWDTVFCPDELVDKTYAELVSEPGGLEKKIKISQSYKAMRRLFEYIALTDDVVFFSRI